MQQELLMDLRNEANDLSNLGNEETYDTKECMACLLVIHNKSPHEQT